MTGRKRSKDLRRVLRIAEGGDAATAILLLRRRVDADPTAVEARECLAAVLLQSGDAPSALSEGRTALGIDPSSRSAADVAAAAARKTGRAGVLLDFGRELVAARPDDPNAHRALMRLSVGVGNLYEAAVAAEWLVDNSPDPREAVAVLHDIARQLGLDEDDGDAEATSSAIEELLDEQSPDSETPLAVEPDAEAAPSGVDQTAAVGITEGFDASTPVESVPAVPPSVPSDDRVSGDLPSEVTEAAGAPQPSDVIAEGTSRESFAPQVVQDEMQSQHQLHDFLVPVPDLAATQPLEGATALEEVPDELAPQVPPPDAVDVALPAAHPEPDARDEAPVVPPVPVVPRGEPDHRSADDREDMLVPPIPGTFDKGAEDGDEAPTSEADDPAADLSLHDAGAADDDRTADSEGRGDVHPEGSTEDEAGEPGEARNATGEENEGSREETAPSEFDQPEEIDLRPLTARDAVRSRRRINVT